MPSPSLDQITSSLLAPNTAWSGSQITFSFPGSSASWSGYSTGSEPFDSHYAGLSLQQATAVRAALGAWDSLINVRLTEVSDPGQIRIAFTDVRVDASDNTWGYAFYPPSNGSSGSAKNGDVWIAYQKASSAFTPGTYDYQAAMHEIGHALGLKHTFEDGATLPAEYDNHRYSIMSYTYNKDAYWVQIKTTATGIESSSTGVYATTPMVFDIAAIQARYGADPATAAGDSTYTFDPSKPIMQAIYDAGGVDLIDLSSHTRGSIVDLTPGAYSSIAKYSVAEQLADLIKIYPWAADFLGRALDSQTYTWSDNLGIAYNTIIENVRGGAGSDRVTGNSANNNISGGGGNDTIDGGAGQDFIRGDDGNDSLTGGADFDDINGNRGNDTASGGDGNDWVVGGQDDDLLNGDAGNDVVYGNLGNDTVRGGAGDDWVRGGQGDDVIYGDAGNDFMSGDRGSDTITGGAGADRFNLVAGAGIDRVTDFNSADGDRVSIEGALPYTLTFNNGDAVISIGNGDQMILAGISNAGMLGTWIFV